MLQGRPHDLHLSVRLQLVTKEETMSNRIAELRLAAEPEATMP